MYTPVFGFPARFNACLPSPPEEFPVPDVVVTNKDTFGFGTTSTSEIAANMSTRARLALVTQKGDADV